jgi:outer membrane protein insertion porin family
MENRGRHRPARACALVAVTLLVALTGPARAQADRALVLESIEIAGNERTPEGVIERHLALEIGDDVTVAGLEGARARLVATDYFTRVEVYTRRGSRRGMVVVMVEVDEHANPVFETGFGYHDLNGWFLTLLGLRFDNALGADSQTRIGLRVGFRLSGLDAEWLKPVSYDGRFGVGVRLHLYNFQHRFFGAGPAATDASGDPAPWSAPLWNGFQQDIARGGGEIAVTYSPDRRTRFSFGVSAERVTPDSSFTETEDDTDYDFDAFPDQIRSELGKATITGFFLRAIRDTRNNLAYPTQGSFGRFTLAINSSLLGGDEIYTRAGLDLSTHLHIQGGWVLSSHAAAGATTAGAPYYERYYLGGSYSIRGFEEWSLSDTDGDDGYWLFSEELRWPLVGRQRAVPRLVGLVFVDVGHGWKRNESLTASDVESAAGYGLRLRLPWLGTLGLDVGIPISEGRTDDPFRVHASLGFSF